MCNSVFRAFDFFVFWIGHSSYLFVAIPCPPTSSQSYNFHSAWHFCPSWATVDRLKLERGKDSMLFAHRNLSICNLWFMISVCGRVVTRRVSLLRAGLGLLAGTEVLTEEVTTEEWCMYVAHIALYNIWVEQRFLQKRLSLEEWYIYIGSRYIIIK